MSARNTYDPAFFTRLRSAEEYHFWFKVRRRWIFDVICKSLPPPAKIIEVGCGTGNVTAFLGNRGYDAHGCDPFDEARKNAWPGVDIKKGDAANVPEEAQSYDIVGLFDVLEHLDDEASALKEAYRVVKDNGIVVVTVPARRELWSKADERSFHRRRYTKSTLHEILLSSRLQPITTRYMFMCLYLPMKLKRSKIPDNTAPFQIGPLTNSALTILFDFERLISRIIPLPIGTSLVSLSRPIR